MWAMDSITPTEPNDTQAPQPPWLRTGLTWLPPLLRQSTAGAKPGAAASIGAAAIADMKLADSALGIAPSNLVRASGSSLETSVSLVCHPAFFLVKAVASAVAVIGFVAISVSWVRFRATGNMPGNEAVLLGVWPHAAIPIPLAASPIRGMANGPARRA